MPGIGGKLCRKLPPRRVGFFLQARSEARPAMETVPDVTSLLEAEIVRLARNDRWRRDRAVQGEHCALSVDFRADGGGGGCAAEGQGGGQTGREEGRSSGSADEGAIHGEGLSLDARQARDRGCRVGQAARLQPAVDIQPRAREVDASEVPGRGRCGSETAGQERGAAAARSIGRAPRAAAPGGRGRCRASQAPERSRKGSSAAC